MFYLLIGDFCPRPYNPIKQPGNDYPDKPLHTVARVADWITSIALLVFGILAIKGFLSAPFPTIQYGLLTGGALWSVLTIRREIWNIKERCCGKKVKYKY